MGYTEKHKDITEAIRDAKGGMRRYWNLMEGSRGTLGCPESGLAIEAFLKVILGYTDRKWCDRFRDVLVLLCVPHDWQASDGSDRGSARSGI
jgi:hypothetical protein